MNSSLTSSSASSSSTCSGASEASSMDSLSSESEELEYGPGIVAKLKSKFLKYSMKVDHPYRNGHSIPASCAASRVQSRRNALNRHNKLKRCSSVENILDDEQQQQQESDKANSPINNETNLIKPRPPLQSIHHSTAPVIKNYFFKSDAPATSPNHGTRATISSKINSSSLLAPQSVVTSGSNSTSTNTTSTNSTTSTTTNCNNSSSLSHNQHHNNTATAHCSTTIKTMAAGVSASSNSSTPTINGNQPCPGGIGRQAEPSAATVTNDDSTSASSVVKKAKSMDSLEWQHGNNSTCSPEFKFARDMNNHAGDADVNPPPPPPPQVPERTSICKGYNRETAKTAVVSPVLKLSPVTCASADATSNNNTSPNGPIAPGRRRSLTRGSTLPPVKPVIAQKPRPLHQDAAATATATATTTASTASTASTVVTATSTAPAPLGPKPSVPPPMNQRPVPPPRAQKTLVASVSPLPASKTGSLVESNNATNCLQATVTPPKPPVSPSASTAPLIATNSNSNGNSNSISGSGNKNNTNTSTNNNNNNNNTISSNNKHNSGNNFDDGHFVTPASSTKSLTPSHVTMATCSLISKNNALNKKSGGDAMTNGSSGNGSSSLSSTSNITTPITRSGQPCTANPNVNVSNNNSNSKNDISRARSPCESTQTTTTTTIQKQSHLPSSLCNGVPEGVESKASIGKSSIINSSNSVVFDFRGKDVQPALGVTSPYGRSAVVDAVEVDDDYRGCMDIPPPCNICFQGENQIVGRGSLLKRRDKGLNISFDDTATTTFEYPSEQSLLQVEDSEAKWDPLRSGSGNLASYQPAFIGIASFELGVTKTSARIASANCRQEETDSLLIKPASSDDPNPWSKTSGAGSDLLF